LEAQKTINRQSNPEPKEQHWRCHNTWLQIYYLAIVIKTTWCCHKNRDENLWNRIENPHTNSWSYNHLIFKKRTQNMCWRKDSLFNKWCWENWISTCRRLDNSLTLYQHQFKVN
jgi:hypothetical protein